MALSQYDYYSTVSLYYHCSDEELAQIPALKEGRDVMVMIGKRIIDQQYVEKLLSFYPGYTVTEIGTVDGQTRFSNYCFHRELAETDEGSL